MARMISFGVLVGAIAVIGFLFYRVISGFLLPMFLAALLVVIFQPWYRFFLTRCGGRTHLAAAATTAAVIVLVFVPTMLVGMFAVWELWPSGKPVEQSMKRNLQGGLAVARRSIEDLSGRRLKLEPSFEGDSYLDALRYVETSLQNLRQRAEEGTVIPEDLSTLKNLHAALTELQETVAREDQAESEARHINELEPDKAQFVQAVTDTVHKAQDGAIVPGSLQYQLLLKQADEQFRAFKVVLFNNASSVWLAELLNPTDNELRLLTSQASAFAPGLLRSVGGKTGAILINLVLTFVITTLAFFFFLADGPAMIQTAMRLSPLADKHERKLLTEFDRISRAVVLATLLSALAQGLLAGLAFWLISLVATDFTFVFSLTLLTVVLALVPFVGAATVWIPVSVWLFFHEPSSGGEPHRVAAIVLAVYGAGIISTADNIIKPLVLHGQSNLHPLLALISVLGGVQVLGPIGILVGPMVVVFLQTLLNILHGELTQLDHTTQPERVRESLPFILSLRQRRLRLHYRVGERIHRISRGSGV